MPDKTKLSVNLNKVALVRNARGGNNPDVVQTALDCIRFGAQGITVHPRPDGRHIRREDVFKLAAAIDVEFNVEGYPTDAFVEMICQVKPAQVTLVPDPPEALTSSEGWDTIKHASFLGGITERFQSKGVRVSLFIEPLARMADGAAKFGADRVELYTGPYAEHFHKNKEEAVFPYIQTAEAAADAGLGLNAGHDLDLQNLNYFYRNVPNLLEVSIGHALVCDALYLGWKETIKAYRSQLTIA